MKYALALALPRKGGKKPTPPAPVLFPPSNIIAPQVDFVGGESPSPGDVFITTNGSWLGTPQPTYTYAWTRDGVNISGATERTYVCTNSDLGRSIASVVTATNSEGNASASSSNALAPEIEPGRPVNTAAPVVTGSTAQGGILSCTTGSWSGFPTPSYSYTWRAGGDLVGGNSGTYVTQVADIGKTVNCTVTATNDYGSPSEQSNTVGPIT